MSEAVKVMVRCRPMNSKERERCKLLPTQPASVLYRSTPTINRFIS